MTLGSLFDGISGFPLAASWCGIETKWISEIDPYCLKVSKKNFPNVIQYGNIKELYKPEPVDIISGVFPCQPFSVAGNQQGKEDNRYLWPEMLRIIREVKPRWVIGENVPGIINLALDEVLTSLEDQGYKTETFIIPACSLGAWHKRDRVWIIANSTTSQLYKPRSRHNSERGEEIGFNSLCKDVPNPSGIRQQGQRQYEQSIYTEASSYGETNNAISISRRNQWEVEPELGRVANGIPNRMDRLKSLGNAIVPQVAYEIFKAINEIENA
jgi:DNA (cytosine-5)-methyltransferase 1